MPTNVLAIIPARGGSKNLPRKNVLPLAGIPLIGHTIAAAVQAETLSNVVVNTDDDEIASVARQAGVEIQRRPETMGTDSARVDPLLRWAVEKFEADHSTVDIIVLLYPTAPLRPASAIDATVKLVRNEGFDSALTLVEHTVYLWKTNGDGTAAPTNYDPARRAPRQEEQWNQWSENKAVYAFRRDLLFETGCRLGGRIGFHPMPSIQSLDIDAAGDLAMAEALLRSGRLPTPAWPPQHSVAA